MNAAAVTLSPESTGIPTPKLGMWIFLASEVMFFAGLIGGYIVLRLGSESWPSPAEVLSVPVLAVNTFILISSSLTMALALAAVQRGDRAALKRNLALTALGGLIFFGIKIADYAHLVHGGFKINTNLFGSYYYMLTGFHGLHVLGGVAAISAMWFRAARGAFSPNDYSAIEATGLYWHFVDVVWIVLFAILCLV